MTTALDSAADATEGADPFRGRLLDGLATSIGERGYRDTTVADIVRHARTSKRTFYEQFASKEECLIDLLRTNNEDLIASIRAAVDPDASWQDQIRQAVDAYVDHIESRPAITLQLDSGSAGARRGGPTAAPPGHAAPDRHAGRSHRQPGVPARAAAARLAYRWRSFCWADYAN